MTRPTLHTRVYRVFLACADAPHDGRCLFTLTVEDKGFGWTENVRATSECTARGAGSREAHNARFVRYALSGAQCCTITLPKIRAAIQTWSVGRLDLARFFAKLDQLGIAFTPIQEKDPTS
jgi:hypothetical protein